MDQWYYLENGEQAGPISREALLARIAAGQTGPADLVWAAPMEQWAPAATALPEAFGNAPAVGVIAYASGGLSDVPLGCGGTGGRTPNAEITARARRALRGRWGLPIGFCVVFMLVSTIISNIPGVGNLASLILSGPLQLGMVIFFLTLVRGREGKMNMLFKGFENFGHALGAYLLTVLFVSLWMLLLIIPGIIAIYAYSQTMYILAADRSIGPMEAIRRSKAMMDGKKWKLFCLNWRFFFWSLLCVLTLGIGMLWLVPYMNASLAAFHDDLHEPAIAAEAAAVGGEMQS